MNRPEVISKIRLYDSYINGSHEQREFHRSTIKNGKKFLALIDDDDIRFIPGHYAVAPLAQIAMAEQRQTVAAATVGNALNALCGSALHRDVPLYDLVDDAYVAYCARSSDTPSIHRQARTYWLLRP